MGKVIIVIFVFRNTYMEEILIKSTTCSNCESEMRAENTFCTSCGFPDLGTEQQRSSFHAKRVLDIRSSGEALKHIKSGRNSLFAIAALSLVFGFISFYSLRDVVTLVATSVLSIFYIALAFWSQKKPLMAFLLATLLFLTNIVTSALMDTSTLYKGIILKGIIVFYLFKGIQSALELRKLRKA